MAKEIDGYIKLQIPAGQANPAPPVGPAIGQRGLNIMEFCKSFNAKTQKEKPGMPIPCIITVYKDKTFQIKVKKSPASHFLKEAANLTKASRNPGREIICQIPMSTIKEIAEIISEYFGKEIVWDKTKPMGDMKRLMSMERANSYGFYPKTQNLVGFNFFLGLYSYIYPYFFIYYHYSLKV